MNAPETLKRDSLYLAQTHEVVNVSNELVDYNAYTQDAALVDGVAREGGGWAHEALTAFGQLTGSAETIELGALAKSFNAMVKAVGDRDAQLLQSSQDLSREVLKVRSNEARLHAISQAVPDPIFVVAQDGVVLDAFGKNEQTKRVFWPLFLATAGLVLAQVVDPATAQKMAES